MPKLLLTSMCLPSCECRSANMCYPWCRLKATRTLWQKTSPFQSAYLLCSAPARQILDFFRGQSETSCDQQGHFCFLGRHGGRPGPAEARCARQSPGAADGSIGQPARLGDSCCLACCGRWRVCILCAGGSAQPEAQTARAVRLALDAV